MNQLNVSDEVYEAIVEDEPVFFYEKPPTDCTHIVSPGNSKPIAISFVQVGRSKWQMTKYCDAT